LKEELNSGKRDKHGCIRGDSEKEEHKTVEAGARGKRKDRKGVEGGQASTVMGEHSAMAIHCGSR
jgi:hypothetical protein